MNAAPNPASLPPAAPTADVRAPSRMPLDEKLYLGFIALGLVVIATVFVTSILRTRRAEARAEIVPPRQLIDFTLTERSGRGVRSADLEGQLLVVNFVFSSCSISCLQVNHHMAEIQRITSGQPDVRLVSLTVDPSTDTPSRLSEFAARFGADTNRWLFLTGERRVLYPLIETSFLGPSQPGHDEARPDGMIHSDQIAVMDATGRLRGLFNGLKPGVAQDILKFLDRWRRRASAP